jgi:hypothetical protein
MTTKLGTQQEHANTENEYFAKERTEELRRAALTARKSMAAEQQRALKEAHYMHCPKCGMRMQEVSVGEQKVPACFSCNGVFLDRSHLKVIAAPQQKGIMAAILNWFKEETQHPIK